MKKLILLCCFFCLFGLNMKIQSSPLELINALKEEMSPQNKSFMTALIHMEIKKNEREIEHLKSQMVIAYGGKMTNQIQRKQEIEKKIERLETENISLKNNL